MLICSGGQAYFRELFFNGFCNGGSCARTVLWPLENHSMSPFMESGGAAGYLNENKIPGVLTLLFRHRKISFPISHVELHASTKGRTASEATCLCPFCLLFLWNKRLF